MKKIAKLLAATGLAVSLFGGVAAAQTSCSITNGNGSGANNTCTISNNFTVSVNCSNGIQASFANSQTATSGSASANGNTLVGNVSSGNATNAANFANQLAAYCAAAPAANPNPTPTPPAGGQGGGRVSGTSTNVTALPKTGANDALIVAGAAVLGLGVVAIASQAAVRVYGRK